MDITSLRSEAKIVTYDNGFANTASCLSNITYVDDEKGELRYRGYKIEDLVHTCKFVEVAYLLVHGTLPSETELKRFSRYLNRHCGSIYRVILITNAIKILSFGPWQFVLTKNMIATIKLGSVLSLDQYILW